MCFLSPFAAAAVTLQLQKCNAASGMVTTLERKQRIYQICSEHDIVIVEDDPYFYLQYALGSGTYLRINMQIPKQISCHSAEIQQVVMLSPDLSAHSLPLHKPHTNSP